MIFRVQKHSVQPNKWFVVCYVDGKSYQISPVVSWAEANAIQSRLEVS